MDKNKTHQENVALNAGKTVADFFFKAKDAVMTAADQNGDGKLDLMDAAIVTDTLKTAVKDAGDKWNEKQEEAKRDRELKILRPIFKADTEKPDFSLPKLIRVAEIDEKHKQNKFCKNSIGFVFTGKDLNVITIYPNKLEVFNLRFYPDQDSEIYYVDPADRNLYIALDNYFDYLKIARISELQRIAQDLGAKHFRVTYKEHQKSFVTKNVTGKIKVPGKLHGTMDAEHRAHEDTFSKIEIAAEMECIGHTPHIPSLVYFKKDPQIQNLISMRMAQSGLTHQIYTLNFSNSSGLKVKDAIRIDAALSAMRIAGNVSVTSEAQSEKRKVFEYEIDF